ncbi:MAG: sigma-54-dependent Fis family transcriptional regulator [Nitrospirae bacterium]|nr:sigma-54-dependent Fis family transcriptional regulator [Nitrospirota bacterium]
MDKPKKILIIDDDEGIVWVVKKALEPLGYNVVSRSRLASGLRAVQDLPQVVLLDLMLPDGDGLEGLREIRSVHPDAAVIMITAHARMQSTITAMKEGAYDYIEKPFDIEELKIVIEKVFRDLSMRAELKELKKTAFESEYPQMIGKTPGMLKVFKDIGKVASKDVTVLITGESGTGKELVAKAVHFNSSRSVGPFVAINAASIPGNLLESELFGYQKGAFTGATRDKKGKIEAANGGTLFLDEISEMEPELQAKLLRFLQDREFSLIGSNEVKKADVRIMGATNKNLTSSVLKGQFREDLYYRFNVVQIKLPPLRERKEDIPLLSKNFLREAISKLETGEKELAKEAKDALQKYDWPGNVRELENVIKRACILSSGSVIEKKDLLLDEDSSLSVKEFLEDKLRRYLKDMTQMTNFNLYDTVIGEVERALIAIVLKETGGNQLKTAKILGINRNTLRTKIREYKIR